MDKDEKKTNRYHPYEKKVRSGSFEKENSTPPRMGGGKEKKKIKKISKLKESSDEHIGGGAEKLEQLRKQLCPKEVKISLERLRCKEILVTIPRKGKREICYWSFASDDDDDEDEKEEDDKRLDCDGNPLPCGRRVFDSSHLKYEDQRVETINAYPSSTVTTSGPVAAPLKDNDDKEDPPTFLILIPFYRDYIFKVPYAPIPFYRGDNILKVAYAHDDLHSILDLLTGRSSTTRLIDAYLLLRLERYFKEMSQKIAHHKLKMISNRDKVNPYEFRGATKKKIDSLQKKLPPPPKLINYHYLSVHFLLVQDRDQPVNTFNPNLELLPDLTQLTSDVQLIAPLYASKHLYLAVFNFRSKIVTVYDSSWHYLPKELREGQVTTILRYLLNNQQDLDTSLSYPYTKSLFSQWKIDWQNRSCPQYDEYSCGIYTIHYADTVLRGIADEKHYWKLSDKRVMQIRRNIAKELLSTTIPGRQLLQAISS